MPINNSMNQFTPSQSQPFQPGAQMNQMKQQPMNQFTPSQAPAFQPSGMPFGQSQVQNSNPFFRPNPPAATMQKDHTAENRPIGSIAMNVNVTEFRPTGVPAPTGAPPMNTNAQVFTPAAFSQSAPAFKPQGLSQTAPSFNPNTANFVPQSTPFTPPTAAPTMPSSQPVAVA